MDQCFRTWKYQGVTGYVFLSKKQGGTWSDFHFRWPQDRKDINSWVTEGKQAGADLYFCPLIFREPRRRKQFALPSKVLYADLDPVDPTQVKFRPTIAWESSPLRYQALWFLDRPVEPSDFEGINKALTYQMGADRGGWDITQVLRIPGTMNHKYSPPAPGRLLWKGGPVYAPEDFPSMGTDQPEDPGPNIGVSLVELISQYRTQIPPRVSRMLQYPSSRVEPGKRSELLWYMEHELIKAKIPMEDVAQMVRLSAWNKYRGRADEWKRITTEIQKIYEDEVSGTPWTISEPDEMPTASGPESDLPLRTFQDVMGNAQSDPGWVIRDFWMRRSHGIIAGEPKTFKSTIALDMAVSIASGQPLWDRFPVEDPGPVLIIQNENAEWIMKDRLEKIINSKGLVGKVATTKSGLSVTFPPTLPLYFVNNYGYNFSDPLHREQLEGTIEELQPSLVMFDPLYLMFDGEINSAKDLHPILSWLLELRNKYRTGVSVIHHWNKGGASSRGGQRMLGSTTLHGWTESALYFQLQNSDDSATSNITIEREFRAGGQFPKLSLDIKMGETGDPLYEITLEEKSQRTTVDLLDTLSMYPGGLSLQQTAKELGVSRRKLTTMVEALKDQIETINGPKGRPSKIRLKGGRE